MSNGALCIMRSYITLSRFRAATENGDQRICCAQQTKMTDFNFIAPLCMCTTRMRTHTQTADEFHTNSRMDSHSAHTHTHTLTPNASKQIISNYSYFPFQFESVVHFDRRRRRRRRRIYCPKFIHDTTRRHRNICTRQPRLK